MITEWRIPTTMAEAEALKVLLIGEIQDIETQLGDPTHPQHPRNGGDPEAYWAWRKGAKWAKTRRLQELRLVKGWINAHRDETSANAHQ